MEGVEALARRPAVHAVALDEAHQHHLPRPLTCFIFKLLVAGLGSADAHTGAVSKQDCWAKALGRIGQLLHTAVQSLCQANN